MVPAAPRRSTATKSRSTSLARSRLPSLTPDAEDCSCRRRRRRAGRRGRPRRGAERGERAAGRGDGRARPRRAHRAARLCGPRGRCAWRTSRGRDRRQPLQRRGHGRPARVRARELEALGVERDSITVMPVPGAFELPLAAMALAKTRRFACIVALGCVIRGDTPHFDYVASEAASGLQLAAHRDGRPGLVWRAHARPARPGRAAPREGRGGRSHRPRDGRPLREPARRRCEVAARRLLRSSAACPGSASSAGRSPGRGTPARTRWSPRSGASSRTSSA